MMFWILFAFVGLLMTLSPKMRLGTLEAIWLIWATLEGAYKVASFTFAKQLESARQSEWYRNSPLFRQSDKDKTLRDERILLYQSRLTTEFVHKYGKMKPSFDVHLHEAIEEVVSKHMIKEKPDLPLDTSTLPPIEEIEERNKPKPIVKDERSGVCQNCGKFNPKAVYSNTGSFHCGECGHTNISN